MMLATTEPMHASKQVSMSLEATYHSRPKFRIHAKSRYYLKLPGLYPGSCLTAPVPRAQKQARRDPRVGGRLDARAPMRTVDAQRCARYGCGRWARIQKIEVSDRPQNPHRCIGLAAQSRMHQKSAPETNSKAISCHFCVFKPHPCGGPVREPFRCHWKNAFLILMRADARG